MFSTLLLCIAYLGIDQPARTSAAAAETESLKSAYFQAKAEMGRRPDDHVRSRPGAKQIIWKPSGTGI